MFNYQVQHSSQTLADGIAEYYAVHTDQLRTRKFSAEAKEFYRCHDVAHVLFGCDISLSHELIVKINSIFGTSAGIGVLKGYRLAESKEGYAQLALKDILTTTAKSLLLIPKTLYRCSQMHKRWHWDTFENYLDTPLERIRKEFGVIVPNQ